MSQLDKSVEAMELETKGYMVTLLKDLIEILSFLNENDKYVKRFEVKAIMVDDAGAEISDKDGGSYNFELTGVILEPSVRGLKSILMERIKDVDAQYKLLK